MFLQIQVFIISLKMLVRLTPWSELLGTKSPLNPYPATYVEDLMLLEPKTIRFIRRCSSDVNDYLQVSQDQACFDNFWFTG